MRERAFERENRRRTHRYDGDGYRSIGGGIGCRLGGRKLTRELGNLFLQLRIVLIHIADAVVGFIQLLDLESEGGFELWKTISMIPDASL